MNGKIFSIFVVTLIFVVLFINYISNDKISHAENFNRFNSYEELQSYIRNSESANYGYKMFGGRGAGFSSDVLSVAAMQEGGFKDSGGSTTGGSVDYSKTNVQVEGVDELDTMKNDGKYIYTVNQNKVVIVEAYPADLMKIISDIEFDNYINGIFIYDNKLMVVESSYGYGPYFDTETNVGAFPERVIDSGSYKSEVNMHVYDISDDLILNPKLLETFSVEGDYYASRLIDGHVYVIANRYVDYSNPVIPLFKEGNNVESVDASQVYYSNYYGPNLMFSSVMAIDIDDLKYEGDVFLLGANNGIYVSENSIYLAGFKSYDYFKVYEGSLEIMLGVFPEEYKDEVEEIINSDDEYYKRYDRANLLISTYFNSLDTDDKIKFEEKLAEANQNYYAELSKEYEKTVIHKVEIDGLKIDYRGSGEVQGYILNQFSMDEFDGNFRIATTTGNNFGNFDSSLNHLFVLDDDLKVIGSVEDLASGERIYSARFLGDKAYMVTFRQVDPLYVIDLSNAEAPKILGYLKVTGFSNYLHPIGDSLLLGIGHEATEEGRALGLKISLFDVSDFENPIEIDKYVVESEWSYSEAEYEHKAVLFDDSKDLLVIPVSYSENLGNNFEYWQGVFAFTVTDGDVSLNGKIAHDVSQDKFDGYYGSNYNYIKRSLFIDDILYTVSDVKIKANNIGDLAFVSEVELPFEN